MREARNFRDMMSHSEARALGGEAENEILTAREAQRLLKIGRTKLWDLTRRNEIPAYRVGRGNRSSLRYKRTELILWLEGNRVNGV